MRLAPILPLPATTRALFLALLTLLLLPTAAAARARWRWPARGQVVERFRFDPTRRFARGQRRGIAVAARPDARVRAACAGPVTFAGRVGRSGLVVAQACGRLSATYLGLGTIVARRGERVAAGATLGTVGPAGRYGLGARRHADPDGYLDPLALLATRAPSIGPNPPRAVRDSRPEPAPVPPPVRPRLEHAPVDSAPAGLPMGIWWLPTGLAFLGAATIIGLARHLARAQIPARRSRGRTVARRLAARLNRAP